MKPVDIYRNDNSESLREKLIIALDDIYKKFGMLGDNAYDFVNQIPIVQQVITSIQSDEVDPDIDSHESTYNHANIHGRAHAIDGTSDHVSAIIQNRIMTGNANGLPQDSGSSISDVEDCDNHTNGSTNFVLVKQAAEADLNQTITDPPTQAEVQAISDKIDALLAKLRSANVLAT